MTITKPFQLGSVSTGTLRAEDLLPTFMHTLAIRNPDHTLEIDGDTPEDMLRDLDRALQECCPPFVYFGAHPGDGADFGFWPDFDGLADAIVATGHAPHGWSQDDDGEHCFDGTIVSVKDGNVTVTDLNRTVLWTTN